MKEFWKLLKRRRGVLLSLCVILAICVAVTAVSTGHGGAVFVSSQITNWGLSFGAEGAPPVGNATADYLDKYDSLYYVNQKTEEKKLYLTFDAGFENGNTGAILDALQKHGAKAAFFLVGNYFETQPELVRRMVAEGHTVGNHTYSHPDMSKISDKTSFQNELLKNEKLYEEITGKQMGKLYRPPQGKYCESNLKMAQELGYKTIFWSLAYVDWYENDQPTKEEAFGKLLPRAHAGAVVLLHSTSKTNGEILDELLTKWEEAGFTFGDLNAELFGEAQQPQMIVGPEWQVVSE